MNKKQVAWVSFFAGYFVTGLLAEMIIKRQDKELEKAKTINVVLANAVQIMSNNLDPTIPQPLLKELDMDMEFLRMANEDRWN